MTAGNVLIGVAALVAWGLFVLASPSTSCPRRVERRGRMVRCPDCEGKGWRPRLGARLVHRVFRSVTAGRGKRLPVAPADDETGGK